MRLLRAVTLPYWTVRLEPWLLVPLAVLATYALCFIVGFAATLMALCPWWMCAATIYSIRRMETNTRDRRYAMVRHELLGKLPKAVHVIGTDVDENKRTLAVTLQNGNMVTVVLPYDYNPAEDNGELMIREIMGDEDAAQVMGNITVSVDHMPEDDDGTR